MTVRRGYIDELTNDHYYRTGAHSYLVSYSDCDQFHVVCSFGQMRDLPYDRDTNCEPFFRAQKW